MLHNASSRRKQGSCNVALAGGSVSSSTGVQVWLMLRLGHAKLPLRNIAWASGLVIAALLGISPSLAAKSSVVGLICCHNANASASEARCTLAQSICNRFGGGSSFATLVGAKVFSGTGAGGCGWLVAAMCVAPPHAVTRGTTASITERSHAIST